MRPAPPPRRHAAAAGTGLHLLDRQGPRLRARGGVPGPAPRDPRHYMHNPNWNGNPTFAVDGSKLNLPRRLVDRGTVQDLQENHRSGQVPWQERTRRPPRTLRPLQPRRHDPPVLQPRRQPAGRGERKQAAGNFEKMILFHTVTLADTVGCMGETILAIQARLRPGRSFPRRSRKPVGKRERRGLQTA